MPDKTTPDRRVISVTGPDTEKFLQGLVTNDVARLQDGLVYAALLSPQGKYLADFFLVPWDRAILIDAHASLAQSLLRRLIMYRLRTPVEISETEIAVTRGTGPAPTGAYADPRHPALGWRAYDHAAGNDATTDWDALRTQHMIPETNAELFPDESYILEMGFERLNGVDFKKGCYVGQEVTARMKHKTALRKGLARVIVEGQAPYGTPILAAGKPAGTLLTRSGSKALAYLRFDRAGNGMQAADAEVTLDPNGN